MDTVPNGSIVLARGERTVFSLWYMRYVERPEWDVAVIAVPLLPFDWYRHDVNRMFPDRVPELQGVDDADILGRIVAHSAESGAPVFFTFTNRALSTAFELSQDGPVYRAGVR
jgi:hypothetical protein